MCLVEAGCSSYWMSHCESRLEVSIHTGGLYLAITMLTIHSCRSMFPGPFITYLSQYATFYTRLELLRVVRWNCNRTRLHLRMMNSNRQTTDDRFRPTMIVGWNTTIRYCTKSRGRVSMDTKNSWPEFEGIYPLNVIQRVQDIRISYRVIRVIMASKFTQLFLDAS